MKKITFFIHNMYKMGGTERVVSLIANRLSKEYEVEIISLHKEYEKPFYKMEDNIKIRSILGKELQQEGSYYVTDGATVCTYELTDGKAIIHNIKATHTYSVTEIYAPDKYILDQNSYEIVIDYSNDVLLEIRLKNVKQYVLSLGF